MRFGRHGEGWCDNAWAHKLKFLTLCRPRMSDENSQIVSRGTKAVNPIFIASKFIISVSWQLIEKFPQLDPLFIRTHLSIFPDSTHAHSTAIHPFMKGVKVWNFSCFPFSLLFLVPLYIFTDDGNSFYATRSTWMLIDNALCAVNWWVKCWFLTQFLILQYI